jgi:flagellar biosynthesis protein FlhB
VSSSERTEKATPKRRGEARNKGQSAKSQEVSNLFVLTAGFATVSLMAPKILKGIEDQLRLSFYRIASPHLTQASLNEVLGNTMIAVLQLCLPVLCAVAVAGVAASALQNKPSLNMTKLKPDFKRLNPLPGFKRFVSPHSLVELIKSIVKLTLVGGIVFLTLYPHFPQLVQLGQVEPTETLRIVCSLAVSLVWRVLGTLLVLAIADVFWSRHSFEKSLKMSKEEVKQEAKQQDLPPEVKSKLRQKQRQLARARMLGEVKNADVVVTNPTHYAVAIVYDPADGAPRVLAKGVDLLALRIRELAEEHDVAIVENRPLARHLYANVEIGHYVPADAFAAVAEVLAFVWRTSRRRRFAWA